VVQIVEVEIVRDHLEENQAHLEEIQDHPEENQARPEENQARPEENQARLEENQVSQALQAYLAYQDDVFPHPVVSLLLPDNTCLHFHYKNYNSIGLPLYIILQYIIYAIGKRG
jgi:hypothetical protein